MIDTASARRRTIGAMVVAASLTGCATGPGYTRPAPPGASSYTATPLATSTDSASGPPGGSQSLVPGAHVSPQWWRALGSPALDTLIAQAFVASPTLAAAEATLRESEERVAARAGTTRYPQADATVGAQRQRVNPAAFGQSGDPREFSLLNATVGVRYRLDLGGGNRRALVALAARADYQRYQFDGAGLTLAAAIATAAVQQAQLAARLDATVAVQRHQEEELGIARERLRLGAASPDEVLALQSRAAQSRAGAVALRTLLQQAGHRLAVLAGREPGAGRLPSFTMSEFTLPVDLPLVIPSELVRRRPDIQAAEALMRAAHADHGVAVARLYPQLDLSAAVGSQGLTSGALFGPGSLVWNLVAQLTQPLLNPGLPAERRAALAAFEAAAAHYEEVVLESLRDMADIMVALDNGAQVLAALESADAASQAALSSVQRQHALGAISYREVLTAEQQAQQMHIELVAARAQRLLDTVALFQAVGGGREIPLGPDPAGTARQ